MLADWEVMAGVAIGAAIGAPQDTKGEEQEIWETAGAEEYATGAAAMVGPAAIVAGAPIIPAFATATKAARMMY